MINQQTFDQIAKTVGAMLGLDETVALVPADRPGVYVKLAAGAAQIGAQTKSYAARGIMLLAKAVQEGKQSVEILQTPCFDVCGAMLDMSRNAVMRVDAVKEYLVHMAALGMNMLMLYTEDTYELKEYPRFGYMRGRYTTKELREIDDFADMLGIEVIPCIQTLGHMEQFLKWNEAFPVKDTPSVLLCGEEDTYALIRTMIQTMASTFRSRRIHIGMDEAHDVGLGRYLKEHGYRDRFSILSEHLKKVVDICKDAGLAPMMWSDMFYRLGSKTGEYYDLDAHIPESAVQSVPDVDLVYWDYYHDAISDYNAMLQNHRRFGKKVVFAGGAWTWNTHLPSVKESLRMSVPAMQACVENGVKEVFATVWGDDGAECNHFFSLAMLPAYSEYCYRGKACTMEDIQSVMGFVTGFSYDYAMALSQFNEGPRQWAGKPIFYGDLLRNPLEHEAYFPKYKSLFETTLCSLRQMGAPKKFEPLYRLACLMFEIVSEKSDLLPGIYAAYHAGDRDYLERAAKVRIPNLIKQYQSLMALHQEIWLSSCKPFGWETLQIRYAGILARLSYAEERISDYLLGVLPAIEELDAERVDFIPASSYYHRYQKVAFTGTHA